jgi:hypothetical protein
MKIKDFISKSIQEYPLLYKDVNYEKSKLKVLNQLFFCVWQWDGMGRHGNARRRRLFMSIKI